MIIYPVIHLKNGNCVRTKQGQYYEIEVYSHFPAKVAKHWEAQGAPYLHVIDLDAAMVGHSVNDEIIREIIESVHIPVQVGGGIRTIKDIESKLRMGTNRVVIGTKAAQNPAFIKEALNIFGTDQIVISIDTKNGTVMMDAWEKISTYNPVTLGLKMKEIGIKTIICTDVLRDGMMQGANVDIAREMIEATGLEIILSGGISSLKDLEILQEYGVSGAILGKALYKKKIDLKTAVEIFSDGNEGA